MHYDLAASGKPLIRVDADTTSLIAFLAMRSRFLHPGDAPEDERKAPTGFQVPCRGLFSGRHGWRLLSSVGTFPGSLQYHRPALREDDGGLEAWRSYQHQPHALFPVNQEQMA